MPYDGESGLVYSETTIALSSKQQRPLPIYDMNTPRPEKRASQTLLGTRSLFDSSILALLRNLDSLDASSFRDVPGPLLERIYREIEHNDLHGTRVWMLFAPTGALGPAPKRSLDVIKPDTKLLFPVMNSPSFDWLLVLTLQDLSLNVDLLLSISRLRNLTFMSILSPSKTSLEHGVSERIIRAWAYDATAHGSFGRLQVIFLDGQKDVTAASLKHLGSFPMLDTLCLNMCGVKSGSLNLPLGWENTEGCDFRKLCKREQRDGELSSIDFQHTLRKYTSRWIARVQRSSQVILPIANLTLNDGRKRGRQPLSDSTFCCLHRVPEGDGPGEENYSAKTNSSAATNSKKRKFKESRFRSTGDMLLSM